MTDHRPPMTPAQCDLRDFPGMMINIPRLRSSNFDATPDDAAWRAGLNLWMSAFHKIPAGALDNDEATLCKDAGLGRDLRTWKRVRAAAMRGWVECSDGRLYHPTVAEVVLEAWLEKLPQRLSSGAGNAKRWGGSFDPEPIRAQIQEAARLLKELAPDSKILRKVSRHLSGETPDGTENLSRQDDLLVPLGSQGEGEVEGKVEDKKRVKSSGGASPPPPDASPVFISIPTNKFETEGEEVPITENFILQFQPLYPAVDVRAELRRMRAWSIANRELRKTRKGMTRFIDSWLARQQNRPASRETANGGRNGGHQPKPAQQSFAAGLSRSIQGDFEERGLDTGGGEIIDIASSGPSAGDHEKAA